MTDKFSKIGIVIYVPEKNRWVFHPNFEDGKYDEQNEIDKEQEKAQKWFPTKQDIQGHGNATAVQEAKR